MSASQISEETAFKNKLAEMGLTAKYKIEEKQNYGMTQYRFVIRIYKGDTMLDFTTSGFTSKHDMCNLGYIQGNRKLTKIELYGEHKMDKHARNAEKSQSDFRGDRHGASGSSRYDRSDNAVEKYVDRFN